jgi:hypothetical protein
MCMEVAGQPQRLVLAQQKKRNGTLIETFTVVLGKVTQLRKGEHKSLRGFTYPLGQTVHDPNVKIGDHNYCLHLIADPASDQLQEYGSHRLVVLPAPQLWDPPGVRGAQPEKRCWHSSGATILFCRDCAGLKPEDLTNPDFWQSLYKPRRRTRTRQTAKTDDFVLRLPRNAVWHQDRDVSPAQLAASRN